MVRQWIPISIDFIRKFQEEHGVDSPRILGITRIDLHQNLRLPVPLVSDNFRALQVQPSRVFSGDDAIDGQM